MPDDKLYALRHLETGMYLSAMRGGRDYVICFTNGDSALAFREQLGTVEYNEVVPITAGSLPGGRMWLNGKFVESKPEIAPQI